MIMEKEFIPYEQALALKELGFDEPCLGYYNTTLSKQNELLFPKYASELDNWNEMTHLYSAPLYQQAFRWFREKYELHHIVIWDSDTDKFDGGLFGKLVNPFLEKDKIFHTYEEAELECLKKVIEIVKEK